MNKYVINNYPKVSADALFPSGGFFTVRRVNVRVLPAGRSKKPPDRGVPASKNNLSPNTSLILAWRLFVVILSFCPSVIFSQHNQDYEAASLHRFGVSGQVISPLYNANFRALVLQDASKIACCTQNYTVEPRLGFGIQGFAEIALFEKGFFHGRLGITSLTTNFSSQESILFGGGTIPLNGSILYALQTSLLWADVEPFFVFRPLEELSLLAGIGGKITLASQFQQYEEPSISNIPTNTPPIVLSRRNFAEGSIQGVTTFLPQASIGASYEFAFGEKQNILLAPEVFVSVPFGSLINPTFLRVQNAQQSQDGFWTMIALRGGLSLRIAPNAAPIKAKSLDELPKNIRDSIPAIQSFVSPSTPDSISLPTSLPPQAVVNSTTNVQNASESLANTRLAILSITGEREGSGIVENFLDSTKSASRLKIEETLASRSRYVLNNIFFAPKSASLDARYIRIDTEKRNDFYLEDLADLDVLQIYYHVLNIIGQRMNTHPKARLSLIGYADGLTENNDKTLAKSRADVVRSYLLSVWGIAQNRITVQTGVSRTPSGTNGDELLEAEEQRRVEIQCSVPAVLEELRFEYRLRTYQPETLRIAFGVANTIQDSRTPLKNAHKLGLLSEWLLRADQTVKVSDWETTSRQLFSTSGKNTDVEQPFVYTWNVRTEKSQPESNEPISIQLFAQQESQSRRDTARAVIAVEVLSVEDKLKNNIQDERIDSYTLFSFAYGTNAPLSGNTEALRIVKQIKETLKPGAKVIVRGYSDARGNPATNLALSKQRAESVANLIGYKNADVQGVGVTTLNSNALPEGRFYNRFVQVDVRTPLR